MIPGNEQTPNERDGRISPGLTIGRVLKDLVTVNMRPPPYQHQSRSHLDVFRPSSTVLSFTPSSHASSGELNSKTYEAPTFSGSRQNDSTFNNISRDGNIDSSYVCPSSELQPEDNDDCWGIKIDAVFSLCPDEINSSQKEPLSEEEKRIFSLLKNDSIPQGCKACLVVASNIPERICNKLPVRMTDVNKCIPVCSKECRVSHVRDLAETLNSRHKDDTVNLSDVSPEPRKDPVHQDSIPNSESPVVMDISDQPQRCVNKDISDHPQTEINVESAGQEEEEDTGAVQGDNRITRKRKQCPKYFSDYVLTSSKKEKTCANKVTKQDGTDKDVHDIKVSEGTIENSDPLTRSLPESTTALGTVLADQTVRPETFAETCVGLPQQGTIFDANLQGLPVQYSASGALTNLTRLAIQSQQRGHIKITPAKGHVPNILRSHSPKSSSSPTEQSIDLPKSVSANLRHMLQTKLAADPVIQTPRPVIMTQHVVSGQSAQQTPPSTSVTMANQVISGNSQPFAFTYKGVPFQINHSDPNLNIVLPTNNHPVTKPKQDNFQSVASGTLPYLNTQQGLGNTVLPTLQPAVTSTVAQGQGSNLNLTSKPAQPLTKFFLLRVGDKSILLPTENNVVQPRAYVVQANNLQALTAAASMDISSRASLKTDSGDGQETSLKPSISAPIQANNANSGSISEVTSTADSARVAFTNPINRILLPPVTPGVTQENIVGAGARHIKLEKSETDHTLSVTVEGGKSSKSNQSMVKTNGSLSGSVSGSVNPSEDQSVIGPFRTTENDDVDIKPNVPLLKQSESVMDERIRRLREILREKEKAVERIRRPKMSSNESKKDD